MRQHQEIIATIPDEVFRLYLAYKNHIWFELTREGNHYYGGYRLCGQAYNVLLPQGATDFKDEEVDFDYNNYKITVHLEFAYHGDIITPSTI